jgi:hypothetical protein
MADSGAALVGRPPGQVLDAVLRVVGGDAQQPGGQLGLAPVGVDALPDGDEHLLGNVLRLGPIRHHAQHQVEHPIAVFADQLLEGALVACAQPGQEQPLTEAHLIRRAQAGAARERDLHMDSDKRGRGKVPAGHCVGTNRRPEIPM